MTSSLNHIPVQPIVFSLPPLSQSPGYLFTYAQVFILTTGNETKAPLSLVGILEILSFNFFSVVQKKRNSNLEESNHFLGVSQHDTPGTISLKQFLILQIKNLWIICSRHYINKIWEIQGFPGGAVVKNPPANAGDTGSSPGLGRSHMLQSSWAREPQLLSLRVWSLCAATREAAIVRGPRTAMKSGPRLPQLEKALAQKRRPNTAINK